VDRRNTVLEPFGVADRVRCTACGSVSPKDKDERFWWACWECPLCAKYVCNQPVFSGTTKDGVRESEPCYVKHLAAKHPHVYERKT